MQASSVRAAFITSVCALLSACASPDRSHGFTEADSAGVVLAVNEGLDPAALPRYRLTAGPEFSAGDRPGDPAHEFQTIVGARRLPDGSVAVADGPGRNVRVFTPDGDHVQTLGRPGDGPGELRALSGVAFVPPDTLLAFDGVRSAAVLFSLADGSSRIAALQAAESGHRFPAFLGVQGDGHLLAAATAPMGASSEAARPSVRVHRYGPDGGLRSVVADAWGQERITATQGTAAVTNLLPLGANTLFVVGPTVAVTVETLDPEVRYHGPEGDVIRIARWPFTPNPVSQGDWSRFVDSVAATFPDDQRPYRAASLRQLPTPSARPVITHAIADGLDHLWLRLARDGTWVVFDPAGRIVATATLPDTFRPTEIGRDFILGVWRDEFDVQSVRVYGLLRSG